MQNIQPGTEAGKQTSVSFVNEFNSQYPLEIHSNECADKELGVEESNSDDESDNHNAIMRRYTSSGRYVKSPKRPNPLNMCYVLETLSESQG
ncbi:hypothetical protein NPIL_515991 [Nephila pilipes]|uniref:Uncharacterized protein n=1 Tax=Nephila pilipes TaxID=299642 RepID=A0A8X6NK96_NEPPI|nr:hypothetical protein NPIL_515991 [Nephila pilipes]